MGRKLKHKLKYNQTIKNQSSKTHILKNEVPLDVCMPNTDKLILITDRLNLPPYRIDELEDGESGLQLDFQPRLYFVSSLCYLCSKFCNDEFPCTDCGMVIYCSALHRQQNMKQHKQLCFVLTEVCRKNGGLSLAKDLNAFEYRNFRIECLQIVERALNRRMELWEREILLYPRLCHTCHAAENLTTCTNCRMEYFCQGKDKRHHRGNHEQHCDEFSVFRSIIARQREIGFVASSIPPVFSVKVDTKQFPSNFDTLMRQAFPFSDYEKIDCVSYAAMSQAASPALTAFYVIQKSTFFNQNMNRKTLKVDIIGAELQFECANVTVWETLFLHFLPKIKNLKLELCGPELQVPNDIASLLEQPSLCPSCRAKNRKINITLHCGKLYHQINNTKPDLVCLFNPGLYRKTGFENQDSWPQTIKKFCDYGVPILVTSYTEIELPRDLARIREFRDIFTEQEPCRNPFASLRPERNFVSDDVAPLIYKNYFLCIIKGASELTKPKDNFN